VLVGLLQRRLFGDPEALDLLRDLRGQLRQLGETVTASLDYLRPVVLRREPVDLVELAEEVLGVALKRAPHPTRLDRHYDVSLPKLEADRHLLGIALVNLITNACEAMAGGSDSCLDLAIEVGPAPELVRPVRVDRDDVAARTPSREVRIAVADNGPGIPDEIRDRIFDPFFTTRERGSGIGLATVQKIVLAHGGSLSLETSDHGSAFRLHLPLLPDAG
jgi:signal transduction histidine kinase